MCREGGRKRRIKEEINWFWKMKKKSIKYDYWLYNSFFFISSLTIAYMKIPKLCRKLILQSVTYFYYQKLNSNFDVSVIIDFMDASKLKEFN